MKLLREMLLGAAACVVVLFLLALVLLGVCRE